MSRVRLILSALGMAFALPALAGAQPTQHVATAPSALAGTWRSAPEETKLATDFDVSVWGQNATSIRTVELVVRATGEATLTVTRKVVTASGRTADGSTSIEEALLVLGAPEKTVAGRSELPVLVRRAERRYPDDPSPAWPLEGLRVRVATFDDSPGTIEVRFETSEGRGSFWETLRRGTQKRASTP